MILSITKNAFLKSFSICPLFNKHLHHQGKITPSFFLCLWPFLLIQSKRDGMGQTVTLSRNLYCRATIIDGILNWGLNNDIHAIWSWYKIISYIMVFVDNHQLRTVQIDMQMSAYWWNISIWTHEPREPCRLSAIFGWAPGQCLGVGTPNVPHIFFSSKTSFLCHNFCWKMMFRPPVSMMFSTQCWGLSLL